MGCGGGSGSQEILDECGFAVSPSGVVICSFIATPTASESITLKNYDASPVDLTGWTLWDANALGNGSGQKTLSGLLAAGSVTTITSLPFVINDSGEVITLKNSSSVIVDQRGN